MSKIDGRKAVITNEGKQFTTYKTLAIELGYPEAAVCSDIYDTRVNLKDGDEVTLLVSGKHTLSGYKHPLWVVEAANGERHIIGENGLRIIENKSEGGESMIIDGVKYREVKRKAAVGERVRAIDVIGGCYNVGDIGIVHNVPFDDSGVYAKREPDELYMPMYHREYVVLEPITESAESDDNTEITALQRQLNRLQRQQAEIRLQVDGLTDAFAKLVAKQPVAAVPAKLTRDAVVKRAADDVVDLKKFAGEVVRGERVRNERSIFWPFADNVDYIKLDNVRYEVNHDKRTVVALISDNNGVWARGIAKAAPGDVFNEHIGRAISLRRALGLEVPAEYMNAPAVEGVAVGDVICNWEGRAVPVRTNGSLKYGLTVDYVVGCGYKVIDDSDRYDSAGNRKAAK